MAAAFTVIESGSEIGSLVDAFTGKLATSDPAEAESTDDEFRSIAVCVRSVHEATRAYRYALEQSQQNEQDKARGSDFVCVIFVETQNLQSGEITVGRLVCIDIHGDSIIEPVSLSNQADVAHISSVFAETQLPVNRTLTRWCGAFLGNESLTFFVVVIQKSTRRQQQVHRRRQEFSI